MVNFSISITVIAISSWVRLSGMLITVSGAIIRRVHATYVPGKILLL